MTKARRNAIAKKLEKQNAEIREKDAAEQRIEQIEMQMKALTEELAQAREVLAS